jgi:hypothetical protein
MSGTHVYEVCAPDIAIILLIRNYVYEVFTQSILQLFVSLETHINFMKFLLDIAVIRLIRNLCLRSSCLTFDEGM